MKKYNFRDYKFRGIKRSPYGDQWVSGYYAWQDGQHTIIMPYIEGFCKSVLDGNALPLISVSHDIDIATLGQYTGLKDINGKEIYEGDIVAEKGHYVKSDRILYQKIQWKDTYSCWLRGEYQRLTPKNIKTYQIEVVGNIYENSDLLNKEE